MHHGEEQEAKGKSPIPRPRKPGSSFPSAKLQRNPERSTRLSSASILPTIMGGKSDGLMHLRVFRFVITAVACLNTVRDLSCSA